MPMTFHSGNILDDKADVLVNPVNLVGVMGGGLAGAFRARFGAHYYNDYVAWFESDANNDLHIYTVPGTDCRQSIISFPTMYNPGNPASVPMIEHGLYNLRRFLEHTKITIAIPALGCGIGGLPYIEFLNIVDRHLGPLMDDESIQIRMYLPKEQHDIPPLCLLPGFTAHAPPSRWATQNPYPNHWE